MQEQRFFIKTNAHLGCTRTYMHTDVPTRTRTHTHANMQTNKQTNSSMLHAALQYTIFGGDRGTPAHNDEKHTHITEAMLEGRQPVTHVLCFSILRLGTPVTRMHIYMCVSIHARTYFHAHRAYTHKHISI